MSQFEPNLVVKKEVRFAENLSQAIPTPEEHFGDIFGGIIKSGQWGWLTKGSRLCITSLRSGQLISKYDFDASNGFDICIITCVSEIQMSSMKDTLIAIGIQYADSPGGVVVLYSIKESTVVSCIELKHKITCCKFISWEVSQNTILQNMKGCLAVGTDGGSVLLVDLNLRNDVELPPPKEDGNVSIVPCHIVDYSMSLLHIHRHFQHCQQEGVHFGIQLEVLENAKFIQSLLPVDPILGLAVGLADGRLVFYDLTDMQVFYVAPPQEKSSPLVKLSFMEPPDDPRPCVYVWAFHENYQNSMAVLHSLMYEKRVVADDGFCYFENFQVSSVRLQLPLSCPKSVPIACQTISKPPSHGNEETISLCALVWKQEQELQTEVLLFDINQWYKEEMPYVGDWRDDPSYLASFVMPGLCCLDMFFNPSTISLFNSIQRPEEHFYPVSLSFDSIGLGEKSCFHLNWPGIQNRVVNVLKYQGSLALLDPNSIFIEVLNARLLPQFSSLNYKATFSLKAKRETLLSVALENNCIGLLKECAKSWADGSHQGTSLNEGLSLSSLTNWLWERASSIKERCNRVCRVLFDHSGYTLDQREKQELCYISKQLRTLADLSSDIILKFGENIPSDVLNTLESQSNSIRVASDYQEILLWLLNIGLLPEASSLTRRREDELNLVPYPYDSLHSFYQKRRSDFMRYSSRKARSCYLLFIDSFLEHTFKGNTLRDCWQESGGDGLYPPISIQAMLRIMLIPDVLFENKCALFLYFFLDLNMAIEDKCYEPVVQNFIKFPSVFKLSASLIKQIQAFWNLDHCHFQAAVDEFISPFNKDQVSPQWQIELFIASLLDQIEPNLALRVLEAKSMPISPLLQLNTYLANDLISEAFHFARAEKNKELLELFFQRCLVMKKFRVIRDLALTESEGKLVQSLLKNSKNRNAEDLSFVYLLQKYKYIEAMDFQDEISKGRDMQRALNELSNGRNNQTTTIDVDNPSLILSAYHTTMTPVTKNISDVYLKIKKRIKNKETEQETPYPLSCQLIKQNANDLLGGLYHSSALGTHFASHYWDQQKPTEGNALQQSNNAPFLRSPQTWLSFQNFNAREDISYPEPFKPAQKRRLDTSPVSSDKNNKIRENPKKRRKIFDRYDFELSTSGNLLTHFRNSTSTYNPDVSSLSKIGESKRSQENSLFLETPFVKDPSMHEKPKSPEKPSTPLPGILKVSQPKASLDETDNVLKTVSEESEKKKDNEEEKSIRFVLPVDESFEEIDDRQTSEREDQLFEKTRQTLRPPAGPTSRKSLRSITDSNSLIPMSKNELQDILDKVKSAEAQHGNSLKTVSQEESSFTFLEKQPKVDSSTKPVFEVKAKDDSTNSELSETRTSYKSPLISTNKSQDFEHKETKTSYSKETTFKSFSFSFSFPSKSVSTLISDKSEKELSNIEESVSSFSSYVGSKVMPSKRALSESSDGSSKDSLQPRRKKNANSSEENSSSNKVIPSKPASSKSSDSNSNSNSNSNSKESSENKQFNREIITNLTSFTSSNMIPLKRATSECSEGSSKDSLQPSSKKEKTSKSNIKSFPNLTCYGSSKVIPPKRALSESSDGSSKDSQPNRKQIKGRASIHSSPGDNSENRTFLKQSVEKTITKTIFEETKTTIFREDTLINFQPQTSSSKVCSTESRFNKDKTESATNLESKPIFSEQTTVVGELSYLPTIEPPQSLSELQNIEKQSDENEPLLDTTVGMTLYDTMGFDDHPLEQAINSENSNSVESFEIEVFEEKEDESKGKPSEIEIEEAENGSSSSVIIVSSPSNSRATSSNRDSQTPTKFGSDIIPTRRYISVEGEEIDYEENSNYDEDDDINESEEQNEGEDSSSSSIEIIESDSSGDLSNSFSNKIRDVTSTSTSSSLASVLVSEYSSQSGKTLNEMVEVTNEDSSTNVTNQVALKESEHLAEKEDSIEGGEKINEFKDTHETEFKLSVTSESITEDDNPVKDTNMQSEEGNQDEKSESSTKSEVIKDDIQKQQIESENPLQIQVQYEEVVTEQTSEETNTQQKDEPSMEDDDSMVLVDETQTKPLSEIEVISEENILDEKTTKTSIIENKSEESGDAVEKTLESQKDEKITEANQTKKDEDEVTSMDTVENQKITEEIEVVEAESTVSIDATASTVKKPADGEKNEEFTPRLRTKSISKNLVDEKVIVASPRSQRNSRSGSMPPMRSSITEIESKEVQQLDIVEQDKIITPKMPTRRLSSSSSLSKNLNIESETTASPSSRRLSRGGSVPPATANPIVTRRRSMLLETLDENSTPDSPSTRTRSKLRLDSVDDVDVGSSTPSKAKRTRLSSISSITSVEQPQTPKTRRRSSITSVDKEATSTPRATRAKSITTDAAQTPSKTPRRLSVSKKQPIADDTSPTTSKKANISKTDEKETSKSPETTAEGQSEDYTMSRRLTRTQLAAMERNLALSKQIVMSPVVIKKSQASHTNEFESPPDAKFSDNESNSSRMSRISNSTATRRVTRSLALKEGLIDDVASIASSTESNKRKRKKGKEQTSPLAALKVIPEEGSEGSSETSKKQTRQKK